MTSEILYAYCSLISLRHNLGALCFCHSTGCYFCDSHYSIVPFLKYVCGKTTCLTQHPLLHPEIAETLGTITSHVRSLNRRKSKGIHTADQVTYYEVRKISMYTGPNTRLRASSVEGRRERIFIITELFFLNECTLHKLLSSYYSRVQPNYSITNVINKCFFFLLHVQFFSGWNTDSFLP